MRLPRSVPLLRSELARNDEGVISTPFEIQRDLFHNCVFNYNQ